MTSSWRESKTEQEVKKFLATTKTISPDGRSKCFNFQIWFQKQIKYSVKPRIEWSARAYGVRKGDAKIALTVSNNNVIVSSSS